MLIFKLFITMRDVIHAFMHRQKDVDERRGKLAYSHIHRAIYNYIFL